MASDDADIAAMRARYELNPAGEALVEEMARRGITVERVQQARACVNAAAVRAGERGEPSRAAFAAAGGVPLPTLSLPALDDWRLLLSRHHRSLAGLEAAERNVLRFARAHFAVLSTRGLDTDHLLRRDTMKLDMFKVIESWRTMAKDVFTATLHLMLYTKQIGARGTLDSYEHAIRCLCRAYYAAADEEAV